MTAQLPANRLPKHILLTRDAGLILREIIRPWSVPSADGRPTEKMQFYVMQFCERLYEALLHIEVEGRGEWNMELAYEDCMVINQFLKAGMADAILVQTWMVLHELAEFEPLELPGATVVLEVWEVRDAISETGDKTPAGRGKGSGVRRRAKLSVDEAGPEVPETKGG